MASSFSRRPRVGSRSDIMFTNAVYYPNQCMYTQDTPGTLNYSCVSLVYYAFASITAGGHVFLADEWADVRAPCDGVFGAIGSLMHLKQSYPHLQVVLSIGGPEAALIYPIVASDPVLRDNFAAAAKGLVEASGLDGVDIHWSYPQDAQQASDFLALLAQLRLYLPEDQYVVTAMLPSYKAALQLYDLRSIAGYVDLVNLAAYDMYGLWDNRCGHHAQLYAVHKDDPSGAAAVQYLMSQGIPSKKILLGIPLYGRSFLNTAGPGHEYSGHASGSGSGSSGAGEDGTFQYRHLPRSGTKEQVDKRVVAAQCIGGDGGFVSYDSPETVRTKAAFCKQKSLGGLFYWAAPADAADSKRSLIVSGFRALHGS